MQDNKLFVGSLSFNTTNDGLADHFAQAGNVLSAQIIVDRQTNRSKGFGFVEMGSAEEAQNAIAMLGGKDLDGRALTVNIAQPKVERNDRPRY